MSFILITLRNFYRGMFPLLAHPVGQQSTHGTTAFAVVDSTVAGAHQQKYEANGDRRLQDRLHHYRVTQPDEGHRWFLQEVQFTCEKHAPFDISVPELGTKTEDK